MTQPKPSVAFRAYGRGAAMARVCACAGCPSLAAKDCRAVYVRFITSGHQVANSLSIDEYARSAKAGGLWRWRAGMKGVMAEHEKYENRNRWLILASIFLLITLLLRFIGDFTYGWAAAAAITYLIDCKKVWKGELQNVSRANFLIGIVIMCGILAATLDTSALLHVRPNIAELTPEQKEEIGRENVELLAILISDKQISQIEAQLPHIRKLQFAESDNREYHAKVMKQAESFLKSPAAMHARKAEEKARKDAEQAAKEEAARALKKLRVMYPKTLETLYLDQGMDVYVSVEGHNKDVLRLKYVLFSRPVVHQLTRDGKTMRHWRELGFRKVIFDTGYDDEWTTTLSD